MKKSFDRKSKKRDIANFRYKQLKERVWKKAREVYCWIDQPEVSILGAYHGQNVGDLALGEAIRNIVNQDGSTGVLQDLYCLHQQRIGDTIILGGGGTGVEDNISQLANACGDKARQTAVIGVEFAGDFPKFPDKALSYLEDVCYISCRSKNQAEMVGDVLQRDDVYFNYDNAFALENISNPSVIDGERVLGYNARQLTSVWTGDRFEPHPEVGRTSPYEKHLEQAYIQVLKRALNAYQSKGWKIVHLPFAIEDSLYAKTYLRSQTDTFLPYSSDIRDITGHVAKCNKIISTRYHSLILAIKCQIPVVPILYAKKCTDLINDLGVDESYGIKRYDLVNKVNICVDKILENKGLCIDKRKIIDISKNVKDGILKGFRKIKGKDVK